jgi:acrylyl-CoA reductase (NADPH)
LKRKQSMQALVIRKEDGQQFSRVEDIGEELLPAEGDVRIRVSASTLNYKDALAITAKGPVVRSWPMVPGIDGVGVVVESSHPEWRLGDRAMVNGFGVGERHWGCLAQTASLKGDWLIAPPAAFSDFDCMSIGTAGYTAMLSVMALLDAELSPSDGPVLVTGATGGVGTFAVHLLTRHGFSVTAVTGKQDAADYLRSIGAADILPRTALESAGKPLQKETWAGAIDCVGSHTLANVCAQVRYGGVVAACGLAQGADFPASVMPFILRGIRLQGIDSVMATLVLRARAWALLATHIDKGFLQKVAHSIPLSASIEAADRIMHGHVKGRIVVQL